MTLPQKRRYTSVWLIVCMGTFLSIVCSLVVGNGEKVNRELQFQNRTDRLATTLQQSINSNLEFLKATGSLYEATERVERQEFKVFTKDFLVKYPSIYAFNWTPRVSDKERQAFEQAIQKEGYSSFQITQQTASSKMVRAGQRQEYFPITYLEAKQTPRGVLGYDLASESTRRSALEKARDTGTVSMTGRIEIATTNQFGVLAFQPIYRTGAVTDSQKARRDNFRGVTASVFQIADLIQDALRNLELDNIDFYLLDDSVATKDRFLLFYQSSQKQLIVDRRREPPVKTAAGSLCSNRVLCTRILKVADRQWSLLVLPESEYMGIQAYWQAWTTLGFGLLLTTLVAGYLLLSLRRTVFVEQLVCERTAQAKLLSQILESLRQNLEMLDLANDAIILWDLNDRIAYWNQGAERLYGWTKAEVLGQSIHNCLQTIFPQPLEEIVAVARSEGYWEGELIQTKRDGTQIIVESRWTLQRDELGHVTARLEINHDITDKKQVEEELRLSAAKFRELAQRETLLNRLASQIRRSLDLNTILETAVHEIRNLLQIDRCFFLWYRPDPINPVWEVVSEAKTPAFPSLIDYCVPVTTFGPLTTRVLNKEITRVDSARTLTDPVERKFFFSIGYTALLALPIHTTSGEIGVVSCGHSGGSRPWREEEVELLQAVADQLAIAIDQAQLYKQSRLAAALAQEQAAKLEQTLHELQQTQAQLVQSEKMSSLGQLVAGVAHEINNPINFIHGNLTYVDEYSENLLNLIQLYQNYYPDPAPEIQALVKAIDLDFIQEDLPKILSSIQIGTDRIRNIVLSLRNFSRLDEAEMKWVDIHEGLDNTLMILTHRLKTEQLGYPDIQVIKDYGHLPNVQCYVGQLNQVFMNILTNAIDAINERNKERSLNEVENHPGIIWICTEVLADSNQVVILISDNGSGMTQEVYNRLFDPFFTTKPVGSGTGLGMSICYKIVVEKHGGKLECISAPEQGTAFLIHIPITQQ